MRFSLNCYYHQALLLVRTDDGYAGHWLWSLEGLNQGNPLAMILYGIRILPLTLQLKAAVSTCLQPWYTDIAAVGGSFVEIKKVFNLLQITGPARGYFPEPTKSILAVKPAMVEHAKAHFDHLGFTVVTGTRHLGGFIGSTADESSHIRQKVIKWTTGITRLSTVTRSSPKPPSPPSSSRTSTSGSNYNA